MTKPRAGKQTSKGSWYGRTGSTADRHAREIGDVQARHAQARGDLQQQQQSELEALSDRHEQELQQAKPGEQQSPDAPPSNMNSPHEVITGQGVRGGKAYGPAVGDANESA
jgi:hypothetical protein